MEEPSPIAETPDRGIAGLGPDGPGRAPVLLFYGFLLAFFGLGGSR